MENEAGPTPKPPTHAECVVGVSVEGVSGGDEEPSAS